MYNFLQSQCLFRSVLCLLLIGNVYPDKTAEWFTKSEEEVQSSDDAAQVPNCSVRIHLVPPTNLTQPSVGRPYGLLMNVGQQHQIELYCSCCCEDSEDIKRTALAKLRGTLLNKKGAQSKELMGKLQYRIISSNDHSVFVSETKKAHDHVREHHSLSNRSSQAGDCGGTCEDYFKPVPPCRAREANGNDNNETILRSHEISTQRFYLVADNLGHSAIKVSLVVTAYSTETEDKKSADEVGLEEAVRRLSNDKQKPEHWVTVSTAQLFVTNISSSPDEEPTAVAYKPPYDNQSVEGHWEKVLYVTVRLRPQNFYIASDWSAAAIAFLIALSVGCCNDPVILHAQLKQPQEIIIGLCCQLLLVPVITLAVIACFSLDDDQAFGLFVTSTVPGGGLAYLFTYLVHGDRQLSAALSFVASWLDIITSPIWTFVISNYWYKRPMNVGKSVGWLCVVACAQTIGTILRGCRPGWAHGVLTWFTRPLLLLAGILLVTLGVYINHNAFNEFDHKLLVILGLLLVITIGFVLGWACGQATKQGLPVAKTLATEAAMFNGLLCVPLLRTSLSKPEGDMAAVAPVWATVFIPIPLAYHAIVSILHRWINDYLQKRKKNEEQNSLAAIIGGGSHGMAGDMGVASVAAVAAAAIAVAPAIAAGSRGQAGPMVNLTYVNTNDSETSTSRRQSVADSRFDSPTRTETVRYTSRPSRNGLVREAHVHELDYLTSPGYELLQMESNQMDSPLKPCASTSDQQFQLSTYATGHQETRVLKTNSAGYNSSNEHVVHSKHTGNDMPVSYPLLETNPHNIPHTIIKHHKHDNNTTSHANNKNVQPLHTLECYNSTPYTNL